MLSNVLNHTFFIFIELFFFQVSLKWNIFALMGEAVDLVSWVFCFLFFKYLVSFKM